MRHIATATVAVLILGGAMAAPQDLAAAAGDGSVWNCTAPGVCQTASGGTVESSSLTGTGTASTEPAARSRAIDSLRTQCAHGQLFFDESRIVCSQTTNGTPTGPGGGGGGGASDPFSEKGSCIERIGGIIILTC